MDEEAETKAIEKWLRMVEKPLETKEGGKKRRRAKRRAKTVSKSGQESRRKSYIAKPAGSSSPAGPSIE